MAYLLRNRSAAEAEDPVTNCPRCAEIVYDRGSGAALQEVACHKRRYKVPCHRNAMFIDEKYTIGIAVPGDSEICLLDFYALN